jgi:ketosteroid isomerase-like protein
MAACGSFSLQGAPALTANACQLDHPMRNAADDMASAIIERWSASFSKLDAKALSSLYSNNAFFFGSNPTLNHGQEGVAAYFNALPRWSSPTVEFTDVRTAQVNPDLINFAGTASCVVSEDASPLSVKISWVIAREDGEWLIVSHHASSKTPLI